MFLPEAPGGSLGELPRWSPRSVAGGALLHLQRQPLPTSASVLASPSYRDPCGHTATLVIRDSLPTSGSLSLNEVTFPGPREEGWTSWREAITLHAAAPLVHFLQTSLTSDLGLPWKPDATCLPR